MSCDWNFAIVAAHASNSHICSAAFIPVNYIIIIMQIRPDEIYNLGAQSNVKVSCVTTPSTLYL